MWHVIATRCVYELWEAFNDIAEGFGLTSEECCEILRVVLKDTLGYSEKKVRARARAAAAAPAPAKKTRGGRSERGARAALGGGVSRRARVALVSRSCRVRVARRARRARRVARVARVARTCRVGRTGLSADCSFHARTGVDG